MRAWFDLILLLAAIAVLIAAYALDGMIIGGAIYDLPWWSKPLCIATVIYGVIYPFVGSKGKRPCRTVSSERSSVS